jgi:hypothetical protein
MECATVNGAELLDAIKSVNAVTTDSESGVYLTFGSGKLTLRGNGKEVGNTMTAMPIIYGGGKMTKKIDPKFLTAMLKTVSGEVEVWLPSDDDPIKVLVDDFTYVVMPLSVDKDDAVEPEVVEMQTITTRADEGCVRKDVPTVSIAEFGRNSTNLGVLKKKPIRKPKKKATVAPKEPIEDERYVASELEECLNNLIKSVPVKKMGDVAQIAYLLADTYPNLRKVSKRADKVVAFGR